MRDKITIPTSLFMKLVAHIPSVLHEGLVDECAPYLKLATMPRYEVYGRRWWNGRDGWTMFSVRIYENDKLIWQGRGSGGDYLFLQAAMRWLKSHGKIPADASETTLYLRDELHGLYYVEDVQLKRQLHEPLPTAPMQEDL